MRWLLYPLSLILAACEPVEPVLLAQPSPSQVFEVATPTPTPAPTPSVEAAKPPIALPPPPLLTDAGKTLILEFETGGRSGYDPHPEWPRGQSGVTIGIGYDLGYYSRSVIESDWHEIPPVSKMRLVSVSGLSGARARDSLYKVRDIIIQWQTAVGVFDNVDVAREFSSAKRAIPKFEDIRANAQAAIISLGFNRGWQMSGPSRVEFRAIRDLVPERDYEGIAMNLRKMVRVWSGTEIESGMRRRRFAEAQLVMTP